MQNVRASRREAHTTVNEAKRELLRAVKAVKVTETALRACSFRTYKLVTEHFGGYHCERCTPSRMFTGFQPRTGFSVEEMETAKAAVEAAYAALNAAEKAYSAAHVQLREATGNPTRRVQLGYRPNG